MRTLVMAGVILGVLATCLEVASRLPLPFVVPAGAALLLAAGAILLSSLGLARPELRAVAIAGLVVGLVPFVVLVVDLTMA